MNCKWKLGKKKKKDESGKSSGPGRISVDLIKRSGNRLRERISDRVVLCRLPKQWKKSHISSIYKKGDRRDPKKL